MTRILMESRMEEEVKGVTGTRATRRESSIE
jgi:hypothetical protein